ncbi:MAG: ankyrin repeat domain-containing protein [Sulfuricella denitrificans]|nr:ankyrin repeat domain-containing protein [Sulfuricella denitrificans]
MSLNRIIASIIGAIALIASLSSFAATIHEVVRDGDVQAVSKMIASNRNLVNTRNELGSTPLHIAAGISAAEMTRLLIEKGAVINVKDNRGATPLHIAAFSGKKANLDLLIARGADVHAKDNQGKTARDYAETTLNHEISDILLIRMLATPKPADRK